LIKELKQKKISLEICFDWKNELFLFRFFNKLLEHMFSYVRKNLEKNMPKRAVLTVE